MSYTEIGRKWPVTALLQVENNYTMYTQTNTIQDHMIFNIDMHVYMSISLISMSIIFKLMKIFLDNFGIIHPHTQLTITTMHTSNAPSRLRW